MEIRHKFPQWKLLKHYSVHTVALLNLTNSWFARLKILSLFIEEHSRLHRTENSKGLLVNHSKFNFGWGCACTGIKSYMLQLVRVSRRVRKIMQVIVWNILCYVLYARFMNSLKWPQLVFPLCVLACCHWFIKEGRGLYWRYTKYFRKYPGLHLLVKWKRCFSMEDAGRLSHQVQCFCWRIESRNVIWDFANCI